MAVASNSYTQTTWVRFWGSGSLVESKWSLCHGWRWQPPQTASCIHIRHIKSFWVHWYAVNGGMAVASNSYTHLTWIRFWGSGSLVESNDIIILWLSLTATSNCFPHQHKAYIQCLSTLICCPWAYGSSLKQLYPHYLGKIFGVLAHLWSLNDVVVSWLRLTATSNCFPIHIRHMQSVCEHWYAVHGYMAVISNSYTHTTWLRF